MRRLVWSLMSVAALALAGCGNSSPSSEGGAEGGNAAQTPAQANQITGQVALRDAADVSPAAKLDLTLVDVSTPDAAPLATKTVQPANTLPISFQVPFNPADVNPNGLYVLKAVLTDGDRKYTPPLQTQVLTKGAPMQVNIQLVAEQTAGEKELAAFTAVQKQIGGMKISSGTKLEDKVSRGWQVFREAGEVKFIREEVDYGDKGFTSTDFAYKDGKPWVVVQQKKSSKDAKPTSTERAAWTADGNLVLKTNDQGGKSSPLSDDEAASLQKQAQTILGLATNGKGK
ncbi:putative lipoprotein [Dyella jiangningensis]|uniref:YbaY family lipoprotein n=1 Tax=Dyella sp. AtDHG13 TaxID=1938897 RepID=UPI00088F93DF|nr:YbaY family lipoprotein [Dyella sp. AtDHG13]PXV52899.1 putative lipoprotein [Dyella sp. AtDHG13]SDK28316.1 putative lipoprotein [Dyella jiangningensis]